MGYDFDKIIERRHTNCSKWDADPKAMIEGVDYPLEELLPLWIADMDFEVAPEITKALADRVQHGVFGYPIIPDSCYDAIIEWEWKRHGWKIDREWILFTPGAVPAAHMAVQAYCQPGDKVIIQRPVYYPFFRTIFNNGSQIVNNALKIKGDSYEIDFDLFEQQAKDPRTTLFILCSPHNPTGRVWRRDELEKMGEICARHNVYVFADELHCDILMPGFRHHPFASLNDSCKYNSLTTIAPSKTFNLAGLHATIAIIPDKRMRQRFENVLTQNSITKPNLFAITGMEAAYKQGAPWLDELLAYIHQNYLFMVDYLKQHLPEAKPFKLEGTFLAWIDFRALEPDPLKLQKKMLTEAKVWLDEGRIFGPEGEGFERIVLACPRSILRDALERIVKSFK